MTAADILTGKTHTMEPDGIYSDGNLIWKR